MPSYYVQNIAVYPPFLRLAGSLTFSIQMSPSFQKTLRIVQENPNKHSSYLPSILYLSLFLFYNTSII